MNNTFIVERFLIQDHLTIRESIIRQLLEEFSELEESNLLYSDFVKQTSMYSPSRIIEIQVNQVYIERDSFVKTDIPDTGTQLEKTVETGDNSVRESQIKSSFKTSETQTDFVPQTDQNQRSDEEVLSIFLNLQEQKPTIKVIVTALPQEILQPKPIFHRLKKEVPWFLT